MKSILTATLLWGTLAIAGRAMDTLRPEQLRAGMKGYGLSVFQGTAPQRFEVEILGVLKNTFPKQDMILIRMSGADLEKHKVIAGMSGSPIYINGKLIGALAYGWGFENEPLAGVTPIHNMLAQIGRAAPPLTGAPIKLESAETPRPLLTPLALSGFSQRTINAFADEFKRLGLLPIAAGSGGSSAGKLPPGKLVPGGAVGVELIRGDMNAVGVGTVTHVDGHRVLAFGHPFFQGGQIRAPAVEAEVHTIMSSLETSFKLASARGETGAMAGDWQSCIVVDTKEHANMIPVTVETTNRTTGQHENYSLEVVDNEMLSPFFVRAAIFEAVGAASGSSQDTMVKVEFEAETATRTVRVANTFFHPQGGLVDPWAWSPLVSVFNTPFGNPHVERVRAKVVAVQARQTAEIKGAYFTKSEARRGETSTLQVAVKPFGKPETTFTVPVEVAASTDSMRALTVSVQAGADAPPDIAPPDKLDDFLDAMEKQHKNTDLVVLVRLPGQGLEYRGKLLKNLPPSALAVLDDSSTTDVNNAADVQQIIVPTTGS